MKAKKELKSQKESLRGYIDQQAPSHISPDNYKDYNFHWIVQNFISIKAALHILHKLIQNKILCFTVMILTYYHTDNLQNSSYYIDATPLVPSKKQVQDDP